MAQIPLRTRSKRHLIQSIIQYFRKKLEIHGITDADFAWFRSYLTNRKQYICINNDNKKVLCRVPQGSIFGPLLFLINVNDLQSASNLLNNIMFADNTNLFFEQKARKILFSTVNKELQNINKWFISNKLSLKLKIKIIFQ